MQGSIEERVSFDTIRYANCWEDADVLVRAIDLKASGTYLSIASAGDNSFSILSGDPSVVVAVDINPAQLYCFELKKAAFLELDYEALLSFLGISEALDRTRTYQRLRALLSPTARSFWNNHEQVISKGIIHAGRFEAYFRMFRRWVLPLVHGRNVISRLLEPKGAADRFSFYQKSWNTLSWRMLFRIFFSRIVMGRLGRDPEFFRYVEGSVAERIMKRAEYALTELPTDSNPYLEYILSGNFISSLPLYLRKDNVDRIRKNLDRLVLFKGTLSEALHAHPDLKFDGFNLSDIFEYMSNEEYREELERVVKSSQSGARLVYWNMLVDRKAPANLSSRVRSLDSLADELFMQDKAFFYKALRIEQVT
jgi:S-adenosylmethionine-diacylglycerol 3-amino-3-carboxypropyl transferase